MRRRRFLQASLGTAGLLAAGASLVRPPLLAHAAGKLEMFSWWTSPGEVEALDALYAAFKAGNSDVHIVNAAIASGTGAGGNMKAVLQTRLLAGQPPDSFQVHLGHELLDSHVKAGRMEPIDFLYESEGWSTTMPEPLISIGENVPGHAAHVFENVLLGELGAQGYKGLWTGATPWSDPGVTQALNTFSTLLGFANTDYLSLDWTGSTDRVIAGQAFSVINGDWNNGYLKSKKFTDFGYSPTPQTAGVYNTLADSFGLPKGAVDRDNAIAWLKISGSIAGEDSFNSLKGSIPARVDAGVAPGYDNYQRSAMADFKSNIIVPSVVHGFAAKESWVTDYVNIVNTMAVTRDVAGAQQALVQAAQTAGFAG